jgi:hypothetical protein
VSTNFLKVRVTRRLMETVERLGFAKISRWDMWKAEDGKYYGSLELVLDERTIKPNRMRYIFGGKW